RLLRQIANAGALRGPCLAGEFGVNAGHNLEQRRLARAVRSQHTDLGIGIKREVDAVEHLLATGIGLGHSVHVIDELARHRLLTSSKVRMSWRLCRTSDAAGQRVPPVSFSKC